MNNANKFRIWLSIAYPVNSKSVTMYLDRLIQFQPAEDMRVVFENESGESLEFDLSTPTYEFVDSCFIDNQRDDTVVDYFADGGKDVSAEMQKRISYYASFGFKRVEDRQIHAS